MHLSLKGSLKSGAVLTYVRTDQALDLNDLEPFTIPDLSGNANTATLYSGIYVSTNGTTDKAIGADATALGSGNYYLTGKIKPAGTTAKTTMDGSTASNLTGLTAGVWQDFQTATASAITPSSINLGWDGTAFNATVDNWSDVKLHDASDDSVVAHYKLYDSADASLNGYPALDCVGGYHGAHVGCAGGAGEPDILQTAGEDFNINTTTYVGKTVYVAQSEVTQGVDALGNSITNPRPNERVLNLTTGTGYAEIASDSSFQFTSGGFTLEQWINFGVASLTVQPYLALRPATVATGRYMIFTGGGNTNLKFLLDDGAAKTASVTAPSEGWHHVMVVVDATEGQLHVDGVAVGTPLAHDNAWSALVENLYIGYDLTTGTITDRQIGETRIYNRALTADEVLKNYNTRKDAYGL